jgi:hypothetical protein
MAAGIIKRKVYLAACLNYLVPVADIDAKIPIMITLLNTLIETSLPLAISLSVKALPRPAAVAMPRFLPVQNSV